jgi:diadenosine tetraphosphate (Ap4A) HIT family hydrolase
MADPGGFALDPRLAAETRLVGDLPLSRVLLMDDLRFPWLVLVPRRAELVELDDLPRNDRIRLLDEIERAGRALRATVAPDKLNVAALGNVVRQLHVHVIARFCNDAAWPRPVWGVGERVPYPADAAADRIARLRGHLGLR